MVDLYRPVKFDSVKHLLFFCKTDNIYLFWKWDHYVLLKIYAYKSDKFQFALLRCDTSRVEQNQLGRVQNSIWKRCGKRSFMTNMLGCLVIMFMEENIILSKFVIYF